MTKKTLVDNLISEGYLKTPLIIEAFKKIDRADFVYENLRSEAYENYPLHIGFGQTISQPLTVAFMLELLQPQPGEKFLDIGSGSGWQTTLLAYIANKARINADKNLRKSALAEGKISQRKSALVIAIERVKELYEMTIANVSKYNFIKKGIVRAAMGDGSKGFPEEAPFDKIIAAAAGESIPAAWKEQLEIGGIIVAPVKNSIFVLKKVSESDFKENEYQGFSFVPLIKE